MENGIRLLLINSMSIWINLGGLSIQIQPTKLFHNKFNKTVYHHNMVWPILPWQRRNQICISSWRPMRYNLLQLVVLHHTNKSFWIWSDQSTNWKSLSMTFMITAPLKRKEIYIAWSIIQDHWQRPIRLIESIRKKEIF